MFFKSLSKRKMIKENMKNIQSDFMYIFLNLNGQFITIFFQNCEFIYVTVGSDLFP